MPETNIVTQLLLPLSLAFIMFALGIALVADDFRRVFTQPKSFIVGVFGQIVMHPLVGIAIVAVWPMEPALAVGLMILAASPGGVTSNLMTHFAKGDTALAISLTATSSLVSALTLPPIVGFSLTYLMDAATAPQISIARTAIGVFLITTIPVALGMAVRHRWPAFSARFERVARQISAVLFVIIIAGAIYSERANLPAYFAIAGGMTLVFNLVVMTCAFLLANAFRLGRRQRTAITMECGLQNGTLAIFVAVTLLGNTTMMVPAGIYSIIMFVTATAYMFVAMRAEKARERAAASAM